MDWDMAVGEGLYQTVLSDCNWCNTDLAICVLVGAFGVDWTWHSIQSLGRAISN